MSEDNLEILREKMREEGFSEQEIKNYEIKIILSQEDFEREIMQDKDIEFVSYEDYFEQD
jgi:hypothetical protein